MIIPPVRPAEPRRWWRLPASIACGCTLFAATGYCWNQAHAREQTLPAAIATIQRSMEPDNRRGAVVETLRAARQCIEALQQAAAADDAAAMHARAALRQLHHLTQESKR